MAFLAVVAVDAPMQLQHVFTAGHLVQPVYILCHNCRKPPGGLQLGQLTVGGVGAGGQADHFLPVEIKEFRRMADKKAMAQDGFGRIVKLLMVKPIDRTKIGDARLGADTGAAEKHYAAGAVDHLLQLFYILVHGVSSFSVRKKPPVGGFMLTASA